MSTNGVSKTFRKRAFLKLLPIRVHFEEDSLATVLFIKDVANIKGVYVTMDTRAEKFISVHLGDGKVLKFLECNSGLYFYDTCNNNDKYVVSYSDLQTFTAN